MVVCRCEVDDVVVFQQIVIRKRMNYLATFDRIEVDLSICVDNEMIFTLIDLFEEEGTV